MARFMADIQGNRGPASRLGSARSGMEAHINGWTGGVFVKIYADPTTDKDSVRIALNGGSGGEGPFITIYDGPIDTSTRKMMQLVEDWKKESPNA